MKISNPSPSVTEAVASVDLSKMGWNKIGLPTAIRTGQPAHEAIERLVSGYLSKGELRKDELCLRELTAIARETLSGLYEIASSTNDIKSAIAFVRSLLNGICHFNDGMPSKFKPPGYTFPVFQELAKKSSIWPGLLSIDHDQLEENKRIVALLRLGENATLNFKKRQWTRKTPEVRVALELLEHRKYLLRRNEMIDPNDPEDGRNVYDDSKFKRLGPLTRANYAVWWKKLEPMFLGLYGKDFENHKEFSGYWKNAVYQGQTNARALIRRDIKKRIQQAFRSIAPKSAPVC